MFFYYNSNLLLTHKNCSKKYKYSIATIQMFTTETHLIEFMKIGCA